jgi:hypothetical protein
MIDLFSLIGSLGEWLAGPNRGRPFDHQDYWLPMTKRFLPPECIQESKNVLPELHFSGFSQSTGNKA